MKKVSFLTALMLVGVMLSQAARPVFIGRRGSAYGVENTLRAFNAGADKGYDMLEAHVRLSADSVFIVSHDGKTNRLGGNLKVDKATLAQLQEEVYSQQREDSVTYTGDRLCTVADFLDVCNARGVRPLLHLKTIPGIKDNDCSLMPSLMSLVETKGNRANVLVLTSMPGVVEYMQSNYPDVEVWFQADAKWNSMFDWIVEHHVNVDIQKEAMDNTTIARFHEKGLKVMTWTVNKLPELVELWHQGIDYVITDLLDPVEPRLPLMVGHRGCGYAVENTAEAFVCGAEMGFDYLECDVRVTADGEFVISHDETTERVGGSMKIAESTLAALKSEVYEQTRNGVTYSGSTICTLAEYLDICREWNVLPVIELKWGTGINNDDFGNMPRLMSLIESKGFRNSCVILTSMKKCLDYLHELYPDVQLQFLTSQYWANHYDWTVGKRMDVDVNLEYVDEGLVNMYHDNNLKVNVWTVNSIADYLKFRDMGVDFLTTDRLSPRAVPSR
ncbi:MAG: hypothetical protein J1E84_04205 [Muribaculaceae bacterium]|nr:hypothetical protein [Muribaculaceae bacterium]